ncbi:unnamed protein product [Mytilus edulis]|uniref:Uncharacterized protein n=1 Tax=Mytilus edulis TaxID=6550 RepID=A0A8S3QLT6_MYTED|nr:unnamed protein product [Mytilus edulis]
MINMGQYFYNHATEQHLGAYIDRFAVNLTVIPSQGEDIPDTETGDWATAQAMDTTIKSLVKYFIEAKKLKTANFGPTTLLRQFQYLKMKYGVLYREIFTLVKENGAGRTRNFHLNLLLPLGYIREEAPTVIPQPDPKSRRILHKTLADHRTTSSVSSDESSDDSVDYFDVDYVLERTVDSEPTFTDEPAVDVTEPAQDAFIPYGDAQPEMN